MPRKKFFNRFIRGALLRWQNHPAYRAVARLVARPFIRFRFRRSSIAQPSVPGKEPPRTCHWEAYFGKKIVGSVYLNAKPAGDGFEWCVYDLGVKDRMRGLGIASKLTRRLIAFARKEGCKCLHLTVDPDATEAVRLYKKLGFTDTGAREGLRQLIVMQKNIS